MTYFWKRIVTSYEPFTLGRNQRSHLNEQKNVAKIFQYSESRLLRCLPNFGGLKSKGVCLKDK